MTGLFTRRPKLPLVPPPYAGESLSGWVQVAADAYGLNWRDFLRVLGLPAPRRLRSLSMEPPRQWLRMLADQIGIDEVSIRDRMTLGQLSLSVPPAFSPNRAFENSSVGRAALG